MLTISQQQDVPPLATSGRVGHDDDIASKTATLAAASTLLALGADLKAYLDHPGAVTIGDFAAVVERLHGEFQMLRGEPDLVLNAGDDYADLFLDPQTREFSQSDIGIIEAVLKDVG